MIKLGSTLALTGLLSLLGSALFAQSVQSSRPIRANTIITEDDLVVMTADVSGAVKTIAQAVGLETRKTLYPGRPIMTGDLGPITVVERNQLVQLVFSNGGLMIKTEGRSLGRASLGQRVRVMNIDSKLIVTGIVSSPAIVEVQN